MSHRLDRYGAVVDSRMYDAYGWEWARNAANVPVAPTDPHGFNAQWGYVCDRELGTYYCRARNYAPNLGRWLERDPIGLTGGMNAYAYCAGQPVGNADPSGLIHLVILIGADGFGIAKEYADEGDLYRDEGGMIRVARGGELIDEFPVSNRPAGSHAAYPDGTRPVTGIEHKSTMGGNYPVTRGKSGGDAAIRGTWVHSFDRRKRASGKSWRSKTYGCVRADPDSLDPVVGNMELNPGGNRITVSHAQPRPVKSP